MFSEHGWLDVNYANSQGIAVKRVIFTPPFDPNGRKMNDKVYSIENKSIYFTCHSVVGKESEFADGIPNRFLSGQLEPAIGGGYKYTRWAAASCPFIIRRHFSNQRPTIIQMYPLRASTWTSGGSVANTMSNAIEMEGGTSLTGVPGLPGYPYNNPLDEHQTIALSYLLFHYEQWQRIHNRRPGFFLKRAARDRPFSGNIIEHNEWNRHPYPGPASDPTLCPSRRYDRFYELINNRSIWPFNLNKPEPEEEEDMTEAEVEQIAIRVFSNLLKEAHENKEIRDNRLREVITRRIQIEHSITNQLNTAVLDLAHKELSEKNLLGDGQFKPNK